MGSRRKSSAKHGTIGLDLVTSDSLRAEAWKFAKSQVNADGEALDFTHDELIEIAKDFIASGEGAVFWPEKDHSVPHTSTSEEVRIVAGLMSQEQQKQQPSTRRAKRRRTSNTRISDMFRVTKPGQKRTVERKATTDHHRISSDTSLHSQEKTSRPFDQTAASMATPNGMEGDDDSDNDDCIIVDAPKTPETPIINLTASTGQPDPNRAVHVNGKSQRSSDIQKGMGKVLSPRPQSQSKRRSARTRNVRKRQVLPLGRVVPPVSGVDGETLHTHVLAELANEMEYALQPDLSEPAVKGYHSVQEPLVTVEDRNSYVTEQMQSPGPATSATEKSEDQRLIQASVMGWDLHYKPEQLSQMPNTLLSYVREVRNLAIQCADSHPDPSNTNALNYASMLINELYTDLESRIMSLSSDTAVSQCHVANMLRRRFQSELMRISGPGRD